MAKWCEPPSLASRHRVRWIGPIGSSRRNSRLSSGCPIAPTFPLGLALSISPSLSTFLPDAFSAGASVVRCAPISCWMPWSRRYLPANQSGMPSMIDHSDRGSQYVSIRYTERLAEAGTESSVGCKGDSYDNTLAETINGLYRAELIHRRAQWKTVELLELATLERVTWCNHQPFSPSAKFHQPRLRIGIIRHSPRRLKSPVFKPQSFYEIRGDSGEACMKIQPLALLCDYSPNPITIAVNVSISRPTLTHSTSTYLFELTR